jgi:Fe-S cluster biogenesis protein NfuA
LAIPSGSVIDLHGPERIEYLLGDIMLNEKVARAIEDVRPSLQADGGDIELISVGEGGIVKVRLTGACGSCPMSTFTLKQGVENYLKKIIPEVTEVVQE